MSQSLASAFAAAPNAPIIGSVDGLHGQRVLVVEDSASERAWLETLLRNAGFEVASAANGGEALSLMETFPAHLVLSDWRMPGLDGIELCRRLRAGSASDYVYFILLTGQDNHGDIVSGLDAGADDYMKKPISSAELGARIRAGLRILALKDSLEDRNRRLETILHSEAESHRQIRNDLSAAAQMQRELLPRTSDLPWGIEAGSLFEPAQGVAGDLFGCFPLGDRFLAFYLADVCGHGIPAAMMSLSVHRALQEASAKGLSVSSAQQRSESTAIFKPVDAVVAELNADFCLGRNPSNHFALVYGVLDRLSGDGWFCQAGSPHPVKSDRRGRLSRLGRGGFPVGLMEAATFETVDFHLREGERLFLYSDGIVDCRNQQDEAFGYERLAAFLSDNQRSPLQTVCARLAGRLDRWRQSTDPTDDVSMFAIGRKSLFRYRHSRQTRPNL
jgi:sigma-B regulation protein RsbU (phosphoserine phosphatase)